MNAEASQSDMSEDQVFTSRQAARHVCVAFRRYFEAHLASRSDQIRRSHMRSQAGSPLVETPAYKVSVVIQLQIRRQYYTKMKSQALRISHTFCFAYSILKAIFPGEPGLAGCPLNYPLSSFSPFIPGLHILLGQT